METLQAARPSPSLHPGVLNRKHVAARLLPMRRLQELYRKAWSLQCGSLLENLLAEMNISYRVESTDLARIPKTGPVIAVSNHPFGILDGLILADALPRVRPDVKVLTNYFMSGVPELEELCIYVDPFRRSAERNVSALRKALAWLNGGGMLVVFPAGEVSHWNVRTGRVEDAQWSETTARLLGATDATAVPVFFQGRNSLGFHALGMVHTSLRTARLGHEFLKARHKHVEITIGSPIPADSLATLTSAEATTYLRWRTYLLASRGVRHGQGGLQFSHSIGAKNHEPVAPARACEVLAADVAALPADQCLIEERDYAVYLAEASQIPCILPELGRLRELTFRGVGEGTGKSRDLDDFDSFYRHLFVWNRAKQEIVGAYRIGDIREIISRHGVSGLYTSTLFDYDPKLFDAVGPALELGRSFIRPEYQKQYAPLLLLWKAIGQYVSSHPEHAVLFGAVSISGDYSALSRELLVRYYGSRLRSPLADYVRPRRSLRIPRVREWELRQTLGLLRSDDALAQSIADLEPDRKSIPVLLKQYVKLGGQLLGFNVDKDFSDVVDGLILVDLRKTNSACLERYLSKAGAAVFRKHHEPIA